MEKEAATVDKRNGANIRLSKYFVKLPKGRSTHAFEKISNTDNKISKVNGLQRIAFIPISLTHFYPLNWGVGGGGGKEEEGEMYIWQSFNDWEYFKFQRQEKYSQF